MVEELKSEINEDTYYPMTTYDIEMQLINNVQKRYFIDAPA